MVCPLPRLAHDSTIKNHPTTPHTSSQTHNTAHINPPNRTLIRTHTVSHHTIHACVESTHPLNHGDDDDDDDDDDASSAAKS